MDFLKLDGTLALVNDNSRGGDTVDTLRDLNAVAHDRNILTIAKSVEDANVLAPLWNIGVDYIQGYFLQEPTESLSYDFSMMAG